MPTWTSVTLGFPLVETIRGRMTDPAAAVLVAFLILEVASFWTVAWRKRRLAKRKTK